MSEINVGNNPIVKTEINFRAMTSGQIRKQFKVTRGFKNKRMLCEWLEKEKKIKVNW